MKKSERFDDLFISGFILKLKIWDPVSGPRLIDDAEAFVLPDEVTFDQEAEIRQRLGRDGGYQIAGAIPMNKGFHVNQ